MKRVSKFSKVSFEQFEKDWKNTVGESGTDVRTVYDEIQLPVRGTRGSAGYDFSSTISFVLKPGETINIPTGIRARIDEDWVLMVFPRSGLGFKYRLQLNNTVGVIDSDYYGSSNEGHIFIKITNDSNENKDVEINRGDRFAQGIFIPYGITEDDKCDSIRDGGFGSTGSN